MIQYHIHIGESFNDINWRKMTPNYLMEFIEDKILS